MVNFMPLTPVGLHDLFARRSSSLQPSTSASTSISTPTSPSTHFPPKFPSSETLDSYPAPGSLVFDTCELVTCAQMQSPLFGKIPPELRNEIFRLVLREYVPGGKEWDVERERREGRGRGESVSFVKRPGYVGVGRVDARVVGTCRRVYEETKLVPLRGLEVCFYMGQKARAPREYTMTRWTGMNTYVHPRVNWFKSEHWSHIRHFHVFAQMNALHQGFIGLFRKDPSICQPTTLTLTLRYTDWWYWESNDPFHPILPHRFFPMSDIPLPSSVQKLTVEFETIEKKLDQLQAVVGEFFNDRETWIWKRRDGRKLVVCGQGNEGNGVETWKWTGPTKFGGSPRVYPHHGEGESMGYVVKNVVWRVDKEE